MPRKPRQFIIGELYHVILRRTDNELLFIDIDDYYRGIFSIYEFNTIKHITIRERRLARVQFKKSIKTVEQFDSASDMAPVKITEISKRLAIKAEGERDLLVEILAFCLMPNHIHLLIRQLKERGISKFMQKFRTGYAAYFRNKYGLKFKGHFFQDRFQAIHIKTNEQLKVIFVYIHTNHISLIEPQWKEQGIGDPEKIINFVKNYKWSSYGDYIGQKNFPSLTERQFMLEIMGESEGCKKWVES